MKAMSSTSLWCCLLYFIQSGSCTDEIFKCDHFNEKCWNVFPCDAQFVKFVLHYCQAWCIIGVAWCITVKPGDLPSMVKVFPDPVCPLKKQRQKNQDNWIRELSISMLPCLPTKETKTKEPG